MKSTLSIRKYHLIEFKDKEEIFQLVYVKNEGIDCEKCLVFLGLEKKSSLLKKISLPENEMPFNGVTINTNRGRITPLNYDSFLELKSNRELLETAYNLIRKGKERTTLDEDAYTLAENKPGSEEARLRIIIDKYHTRR